MSVFPSGYSRTVAFNPVPGKYGFVQIWAGAITGIRLNVAQWSPQQQASPLSVNNFNTPMDGNETMHAEDVIGIANTTFSIVGVRDNTAGIGYHPTVGDTGYGILGYNTSLYWPIYFLVISVGGSCAVDGVSGVEFTVKAVGLAVMAGANGGAQ